MIVTFQSNAYKNITMLADVAKSVLSAMGCEGSSGVINAQNIPTMLLRLQTAISEEKVELASQPKKSSNDTGDDFISLANRAFTLIEMLQAAQKEKSEVTWNTK